MSREEHDELLQTVRYRKDMKAQEPEAVHEIPLPAALHTIEGAVHWAAITLWQDRPWLVALGLIAITAKVTEKGWAIIKYLLF